MTTQQEIKVLEKKLNDLRVKHKNERPKLSDKDVSIIEGMRQEFHALCSGEDVKVYCSKIHLDIKAQIIWDNDDVASIYVNGFSLPSKIKNRSNSNINKFLDGLSDILHDFYDLSLAGVRYLDFVSEKPEYKNFQKRIDKILKESKRLENTYEKDQYSWDTDIGN